MIISDEKEKALSLISKIDSGEAGLFSENIVDSQKYILYKFFNDGNNIGVFFSFLYYDMLRIHISFNNDTDKFTVELYELFKQSQKLSKSKRGIVWLQNENRKIIIGLQEKFEFNPKGIKNSHYASVEYIKKRENFVYTSDDSICICGYEDEHIDRYLNLLDETMDFCIPPSVYIKNKIIYRKKFIKLKEKNSFEAFWTDNELIGLYWRSNAEINTMAVSAKYQRKGYGSLILSRAIECVFKNTSNEYAYLYCVDWNEKGQKFYKKNGMETNGHSYGLSFG